MELWIRSQDKEVLTKVIDVYKQADTNEIWSYSDSCIKNCLGVYKTEERALEVLDEIQRHIVVINDNNDHFYVYEMPED